MRVRIIDHPDFRHGSVVDLPAERAIELLRAGQAAPVAVKPGDERETRDA